MALKRFGPGCRRCLGMLGVFHWHHMDFEQTLEMRPVSAKLMARKGRGAALDVDLRIPTTSCIRKTGK